MKKLVIIMLLFSSCYSTHGDSLYNFKCTKSQMEKVKEETILCEKHTAPLNKWNCFPASISRNCTRIVNIVK